MTKTKRITCDLVRLQGGKCYYCQDDIHFDDPRCPDRASFDHMVLASEGGELSHENGVAACTTCNSLRGAINWIKWISFTRSDMFRDCVKNIKRHRRESLATITKLDEQLEAAREKLEALKQQRNDTVRPTKKAVAKYTKRILAAVA